MRRNRVDREAHRDPVSLLEIEIELRARFVLFLRNARLPAGAELAEERLRDRRHLGLGDLREKFRGEQLRDSRGALRKESLDVMGARFK